MTSTHDASEEAITAVHLDAVGGVAGDMFAAALLNAMPSAWPACERAIAAMQPPGHVRASIADHTDGVLTGAKFNVAGVDEDDDHHHHEDQLGGKHSHHAHHSHHHSDHVHRSWRDIRRRLMEADLSASERDAAIGIFSLLATAEAAVHGIAVDDVSFHEVGAWDSIIDIVVAAVLIARLPGCRWSVGSLPRGRGLVKTAHGMLPVPAPATAELLNGFALHDDEEEGERITPTGAAILRYLAPSQLPNRVPQRLVATGTGFGTRRFKYRSNVLRAVVYGGAAQAHACDVVEVLRCEVDDQTPEDLAIALDKIRDADGVLDVCHWPVFAKKGRMAMALQVLVRQGDGVDVAKCMLDETTTLGVRRATVMRELVERRSTVIGEARVKQAIRPSATTAKAEADDLAMLDTHAARQNARRRLEERALRDDAGDNDNDT